MKIYVCNVFYDLKEDGEYIENQLHFLTLQDAKEYGELWVNDFIGYVNKENVDSIGYEISHCYLENKNISEDDLFNLIHSACIEGAEFDESNIDYKYKVKIGE